MWRDICAANSDRLLDELGRFSAKLAQIRKLLQNADTEALEELFTEARAARNEWMNSTWSGRKPDHA
jgi:prephenate dehydrogenase